MLGVRDGRRVRNFLDNAPGPLLLSLVRWRGLLDRGDVWAVQRAGISRGATLAAWLLGVVGGALGRRSGREIVGAAVILAHNRAVLPAGCDGRCHGSEGGSISVVARLLGGRIRPLL